MRLGVALLLMDFYILEDNQEIMITGDNWVILDGDGKMCYLISKKVRTRSGEKMNSTV